MSKKIFVAGILQEGIGIAELAGRCDTLEEYNKLFIEYIEEQAYGSWMDGAR